MGCPRAGTHFMNEPVLGGGQAAWGWGSSSQGSERQGRAYIWALAVMRKAQRPPVNCILAGPGPGPHMQAATGRNNGTAGRPCAHGPPPEAADWVWAQRRPAPAGAVHHPLLQVALQGGGHSAGSGRGVAWCGIPPGWRREGAWRAQEPAAGCAGFLQCKMCSGKCAAPLTATQPGRACRAK